jgi:ribosome-associated toxin RatA of RatAB toxin-antitoxin module
MKSQDLVEETAETQVPYPLRPHNQDKPFIACKPCDFSIFETAPVQFKFTQQVPVSPSVLFDVFEDPESWPKWVMGIAGVDWTSPKPFTVGTTRTVHFWGGASVYEEFIRWEREREMAFVFYGTTELIWKYFGEHWVVEDLGNNQCQITWTVAYEPAGTFGKLHGLIRGLLKYVLRSHLRALVKYCKNL